MGLEAARKKALEQILLAKDMEDETSVINWLTDWFKEFKDWEGEETFERAFTENRMCARMAPTDEAKTFQKKTWITHDGRSGPALIRAQVMAIPDMQNPDNFLNKLKNDLGLHDVSAVLLNSTKPISKQLFSKVGRQPVFIPIPHEEDLELLYQIERVAKPRRGGKIYDFYVYARARITRIKYGSDEDMTTEFLKVEYKDKPDELHLRYGDASVGGKTVHADILRERRMAALQYKSKVLTGKATDNNEVTLKIRQHAGGFPWPAVPGPLKGADIGLAFDIPDKTYLMVGLDQTFKGFVSDDGKFTPMK